MIEGLYIHIPFCDNICSYCDFYKMIAKDELKEKYIYYLIRELHLKKKYLKHLRTIYIGGGTPSSLDIELLEQLFIELSKLINLKDIQEFTIEANPCDIKQDFIDLIKKYHLNRISLGVQSFDNHVLQVLGRTHNRKIAISALELLKKNHFYNVNIDIIYGLKTDSFKRVKSDLKIARKLGVKHFSIYSLIIEEKTLLSYLQKKGKFTRLDDSNDAKIYYKMVKYLKRHRYHQYEVSNFAKRNYQSLHNLIYWHNNQFVGIGPSASYYIENTRYTNINNLNSYFRGLDEGKLIYKEENHLNQSQKMIEEILMGFRKTSGIRLEDFKKKYYQSIFEAFPKINQLIKEGFIKQSNDSVYVPQNKLFLLNAILVRIM